MTHPDFITVEAELRRRIEADRADISITVSGSALFSGTMALQKAREVADLVTALRGADIDETQIHIDGIKVETQSGTFSKSSSAYYTLRVENVPLERIADVTGAIAAAKNATLNQIEWRFADETPLRDELRQKCVQMALERARCIAQELGVRLIGIYEMEENWQGGQSSASAPRSHYGSLSRAKRVEQVSEAELGMAVSHSETVHLKLTFKFRVSDLAN